MNMNELNKLPDYISVDECRHYFQDVLKSFEEKKIEKREFLENVIELTDRQCRTYEILEEKTRKQLDRYICKLWNTENYDDVDCITYIVANIGLEETFEKIMFSLENDKNMNDDILQEIKEFVEESEGDISNPYRFLQL